MIKIVVSDIFGQDKIHNVLSSRPDFKIVGSSKDNYHTITIANLQKPDIIILTMCMENSEAEDIIPLLKARYPKTGIILIIYSSDEEYICRVISHEASAYLLDGDKDILCDVVQKVFQGEHFISADIAAKILPTVSKLFKDRTQKHSAENNPITLPKNISCKELFIIRLIAKGLSTKEIAEKLHLTNGTIRNYISNILRKTGVKNRNHILIFAGKIKL